MILMRSFVAFRQEVDYSAGRRFEEPSDPSGF
jgi:hypothetical protein